MCHSTVTPSLLAGIIKPDQTWSNVIFCFNFNEKKSDTYTNLLQRQKRLMRIIVTKVNLSLKNKFKVCFCTILLTKTSCRLWDNKTSLQQRISKTMFVSTNDPIDRKRLVMSLKLLLMQKTLLCKKVENWVLRD